MIDVLLSGVYHVRGPNLSGSQPNEFDQNSQRTRPSRSVRYVRYAGIPSLRRRRSLGGGEEGKGWAAATPCSRDWLPQCRNGQR